jgi:hypothetical protein
MTCSDNNFGDIVIYNAVKHPKDILTDIVLECYRIGPSG